MKKIISLMVLLLMVATVSAATTKEDFTTYVNTTVNDTTVKVSTESVLFPTIGPWTCNGTLTGPSTFDYPILFSRDVSYEEIGGLENLTKFMEELVKVNMELTRYGNDTRTYLEKYNDMNAAHARVVVTYDACKLERDIYKNDSIQLAGCQSDLMNSNSIKNQCNSDLVKSNQDLTDQKASTQTAWIVGILIGAGGFYLFTRIKEYNPSEKSGFQ